MGDKSVKTELVKLFYKIAGGGHAILAFVFGRGMVIR